MIEVLLTLVPGPATILIVHSAARGGWSSALRTIAGNSLGILVWGLAAALGIAALVAASATGYTVLKLVCGAVPVVLGIQALLRARRAGAEAGARSPRRAGRPFAAGVATSVSNPKLAVFFVALFPQFIPAGEPALPHALALVALQVACDVVYYSALAYLVTRAGRVLRSGRWLSRIERVAGSMMIGLGLRVALERR